MVTTYQPDTLRGQVRELIRDTAVDDGERILDDNSLDTFLALAGNNVLLAAALAAESIAANDAHVLKQIEILGLSISPAGAARVLLDLAASWRATNDAQKTAAPPAATPDDRPVFFTVASGRRGV